MTSAEPVGERQPGALLAQASLSRLAWFSWCTLAAGTGAVTMVVELSAVRLLAPYFGTSLSVWTHVIGVLLLGLALGYGLGAKLCSKEPARRLVWTLLLAAVCCAALPFAARALARYLLPAELSLAAAASILWRGSLATSLACFLLPAVALGAVGPLVVEVLFRRGQTSAGTIGGRILAASTLGSLAGTFLTSAVFLPRWGLTQTYLGAAALLVLLALLVALAERSRALLLLALLIGGGLQGLPAVPPAALRPGLELLAQRESPYVEIRVVAEPSSGLRYLAVNEHSDSFQSVWAPEAGLLPPGFYYNYFALAPWWQAAELERAGLPAPVRPYRVLCLGLGAGTAWRVLSGALPDGLQLEGLGVELDPVVVELAQEFMGLELDNPTFEVLAGMDARSAASLLAQSQRRFDLVILDCYANQMEVPEHLGTLECFQLLLGLLEPAGMLAVNVGAFDLEDPVLEILAAGAARASGQRSLALAVKNARNAILFARSDRPLIDPREDLFLAGPPELVEDLISRRAGGFRWFESGPVASDDRSNLAQAQQRSIERAQRPLSPRPQIPVVALSAGQDAEALGQAAEAAGQLGEALEWFASLAPGTHRALLEARILHRAGRYAEVFLAAMQGLGDSLDGRPADVPEGGASERLELAWWGTNAALWLGRGALAQRALADFEAELRRAESSPGLDLGAWRSAFDGYQQQVVRLIHQDAASRSALRRSRDLLVAGALLTVGLGLTAVAPRRPAPLA